MYDVRCTMYDVRCTMYQGTKYKRKEPHSAALFNSQFSILNSQFSTYFPGLALKLYATPMACWNDRSSVRMIFWLLGFTFTSRSYP